MVERFEAGDVVIKESSTRTQVKTSRLSLGDDYDDECMADEEAEDEVDGHLELDEFAHVFEDGFKPIAEDV